MLRGGLEERIWQLFSLNAYVYVSAFASISKNDIKILFFSHDINCEVRLMQSTGGSWYIVVINSQSEAWANHASTVHTALH